MAEDQEMHNACCASKTHAALERADRDEIEAESNRMLRKALAVSLRDWRAPSVSGAISSACSGASSATIPGGSISGAISGAVDEASPSHTAEEETTGLEDDDDEARCDIDNTGQEDGIDEDDDIGIDDIDDFGGDDDHGANPLHHGMSEYEIQRCHNVSRNNMMLQSLGLQEPLEGKPSQQQPRPRPRVVVFVPHEERRRSVRLCSQTEERDEAQMALWQDHEREAKQVPLGQCHHCHHIHHTHTPVSHKRHPLFTASQHTGCALQAQESFSEEQAASAMLQLPRLWEQVGTGTDMAHNLAMVGRGVVVPWRVVRGYLVRESGWTGQASTRTCSVRWVRGVVKQYSATLNAHFVGYEDGDQRWEEELCAILPAGDMGGVASSVGEPDYCRQSPFDLSYVSASATNGPMEHTLQMGLPKVQPVRPLSLAMLGTDTTWWRTKPVGFLESLHEKDRIYFDSMAGSLAQNVVRLIELCMATVRDSAATSSVIECKLLAIFGNALFVHHNVQGDKTEKFLQVGIFETSTVPMLQTKAAMLCHGMPKSENAFGIATYVPKQAQSLAALTPKELQHDISMFGLAITVLTRSLLRKLANMALPELSLTKLSRRRLARLVQHTFHSASHDLQALTFNLSALLAFGHDKGESSPIIDTCLENVYSANGWHANTARSATRRVRKVPHTHTHTQIHTHRFTHTQHTCAHSYKHLGPPTTRVPIPCALFMNTQLLFDPKDVGIMDTLGNISVKGESRTEQIADFFGMTEKEMGRQTTGLATCFIMEARRLAGAREFIVINWDTHGSHECLGWAVSRKSSIIPWRGMPALVVTMLFTHRDGYQKGDNPGRYRMLELGAARVAQLCGFNFVLTSRTPGVKMAALAALGAVIDTVLAATTTVSIVGVLRGDALLVDSLLTAILVALPAWANPHATKLEAALRIRLAFIASEDYTANDDRELVLDAIVEWLTLGLVAFLPKMKRPRPDTARVASRVLASNGGHIGWILLPSVVRREDEEPGPRYRAALEAAVEALSACEGMDSHGAVDALAAFGAVRVERTTVGIAEVQEQNFPDVVRRFETTFWFTMLTLVGNLNCTPEKRARFLECAGDPTLRRRLVVVQESTGLAPPASTTQFSLSESVSVPDDL